MRKPFRLLIAVPCTDYMHASFTESLLKLTVHLHREGIKHDVEIIPGTLVYMARNKLASKAMSGGYTHILFIDSDMVFDENIVETLMFSRKDFVCGTFHSRRPPYGTCIFSSLEPVEKVKQYGNGLEPFRIKGCGMACTMISTEILKAVQYKFGTCFNPEKIHGVNFGEDLAFCWRADNIGTEIWCDPTAKVGHIAHIPVWPGEDPATL